ncbi:hypothetical protein F8S13_24735 [Chloroflexia bacterium SDU3-3]|nr:hypothetical protein F8S13_24735 [Chloroflexia bacterium SDU3-3]
MQFPYRFGEDLVWVQKLPPAQWGGQHQQILHALAYRGGQLQIAAEGWRSAPLGAGEEKAVFVVCDPQRRVFALELIDERHYLNGRFIGGAYFHTARVASLAQVPFSPAALIGLTFTGLVKAREFAYGYEWDRFQLRAAGPSRADWLLTSWLQSHFQRAFADYAARYRDVHGRNVLFELRPRDQPGALCPTIDHTGRLRLVRVGLQPIDLR